MTMIRKVSIISRFGLIEFKSLEDKEMLDCILDQIKAEIAKFSNFNNFPKIEVNYDMEKE